MQTVFHETFYGSAGALSATGRWAAVPEMDEAVIVAGGGMSGGVKAMTLNQWLGPKIDGNKPWRLTIVFQPIVSDILVSNLEVDFDDGSGAGAVFQTFFGTLDTSVPGYDLTPNQVEIGWIPSVGTSEMNIRTYIDRTQPVTVACYYDGAKTQFYVNGQVAGNLPNSHYGPVAGALPTFARGLDLYISRTHHITEETTNPQPADATKIISLTLEGTPVDWTVGSVTTLATVDATAARRGLAYANAKLFSIAEGVASLVQVINPSTGAATNSGYPENVIISRGGIGLINLQAPAYSGISLSGTITPTNLLGVAYKSDGENLNAGVVQAFSTEFVAGTNFAPFAGNDVNGAQGIYFDNGTDSPAEGQPYGLEVVGLTTLGGKMLSIVNNGTGTSLEYFNANASGNVVSTATYTTAYDGATYSGLTTLSGYALTCDLAHDSLAVLINATGGPVAALLPLGVDAPVQAMTFQSDTGTAFRYYAMTLDAESTTLLQVDLLPPLLTVGTPTKSGENVVIVLPELGAGESYTVSKDGGAFGATGIDGATYTDAGGAAASHGYLFRKMKAGNVMAQGAGRWTVDKGSTATWLAMGMI